MPILLVAGARDAKFRAIAQEMAVAIGPNASVALVDGAGHAAPFERPPAFLSIVRAWLSSHPSPTSI
jgi:pimeloyl-ACP methyl ester carboxylesterase